MSENTDLLPESIRSAILCARIFATSKAKIGLTEKEHILGLASLLEKTALQLQAALAQQPAPTVHEAGQVQAPDSELAFSALPCAGFWRWLHRCNPAAPVAVQLLPYWAPCNPACDPELNGSRSKLCDCAQAMAALAAPPAAEQPADTAMPGVLELLRERRKLDGDARYLFGDDRVWAEKADAFLVSTAAEQPNHSAAADMVWCACGDGYPALSYGAGFISGSGMCENCDAALPAKDMAAEPDTVKAPRELLDSAARSCANGWVDYHTARELRALLSKEGEE